MWLDPGTLFISLMLSITISGVALLWSWWSDRSEGLLAWCGGGLLSASLGILIFTEGSKHADRLLIGLGSTVILGSLAFAWIGALRFNQRPVPSRFMVAILAVWIVFWGTPLFDIWPAGRALVASSLAAVLLLMATLEFRRGEPFAARVPLLVLLGFHTAIAFIRMPLVVGLLPSGSMPMESPWISLFALEGMIAVQAYSILVLALVNERLERRLRHAADTDVLTGIFNRRAFLAEGQSRLDACRQAGKPFGVVLFDLDDFKMVNDSYGHPTGDAVLRAFGQAMRDCLSPDDVAGRLGGEEFALALPNMEGRAAMAMARRVLDRFTLHAVNATEHDLRCTASGGIASSAGGEDGLEALLGDADRALYDAKREGDNILRLAGVTPTAATGT